MKGHSVTADDSDKTVSPCCAPRAARRVSSARVGPAETRRGSPGRLHTDLIDLPGGMFLMGSDDPEAYPADREGPPRLIQVEPFSLARTAVTNREFAAFVEATGHRTDAETVGWSFVFHLLLHPDARHAVMDAWVPGTPWWLAVRGATWSAPDGPGSSIEDRLDHPVVHVSVRDAEAFCRWAGMRLPSESEWEYAARGGLDGAKYPWGDELHPEGRHMCNIWHGNFPQEPSPSDPYTGTAPVTAFPPNGFGLYNLVGNVWEICADSWNEDVTSERVIRGGSYLCHASYCTRYRVSARTRTTFDSSTGNTGFRVAR
jgi:formylglycine-generating enzyme